MKIKAIAVDIDGTITDENRKISIKAIEALGKAEDTGIPVILVTGNIYYFAYATAILIGCSGGIVAENGGVIAHQKDGILKMDILGDIKKGKLAYNHLLDNLGNEYEFNLVDDTDGRLSEIAIYKTFNINIIKDTLKDLDVEVYDSNFAVNLTDPKVNKGLALKTIAKRNKIDTKDILACGDSENDIEFLNTAGYKVAVENAHEKLKEIADYITDKPYGDGLAEFLNEHVLEHINNIK
ncbi:MAG: phosphoglycolate phosphatase [Methanobrevibacter sp.]|jgi:phosphoglycolate phosphatase (TIGR01487 family)|nr:phosphoglycolate phosphatase [Methanobrevibacter sp.]